MARLTVSRALVTQSLGPALIYAPCCMVALLVASVSDEAWLLPLFMAGIIVTWLTWRHTSWRDLPSRYLSFGAVLLLACVLNRMFYIADYLIAGSRFDEWPFWATSPRAAVFKGEVITVIGTLLTVFAWRLAGGMRISVADLLEQPRHTHRMMQIIYALALCGLLISWRIPRIASLFGQLLPTLLGLGLVTAFLLPVVKVKHDLLRLLAVTFLSLPFAFMASQTGMKENMILAVIPSAVLAWRYFRHPILRAGMVVLGLAVLALITSYVSMYRNEVWIPASNGLPVSTSVPQDFIVKIHTMGLAQTMGDGLQDFIERSNSSLAHGWAISIADEQEFHPGLVFAPMAYVFIPRVLWSGKPLIDQGGEYSGLVFGERYASSSRSSTAAGLYPAFYLGWGWPAVVFGSLLLGTLLAFTTRMAQHFGGNSAAGLYIFSMLPFVLRLDATWTVGALSGPVVSLVYVLVIVTAARVAARMVFHTRSKTADKP